MNNVNVNLGGGDDTFNVVSTLSFQTTTVNTFGGADNIRVGTDDPQALTASGVRDQLAAGHTSVSGGIYVSANIGAARSGDTTTGAGSPQQVDVTIQAATWIDVDAIDVVVDGETVDTIPVMPGDADPTNPAIRWRGQIPLQVSATGGFVVIAAYAQRALDPVHPGKIPFGVTNPIFVTP